LGLSIAPYDTFLAHRDLILLPWSSITLLLLTHVQGN
jgi:hypothetical protein